MSYIAVLAGVLLFIHAGAVGGKGKEESYKDKDVDVKEEKKNKDDIKAFADTKDLKKQSQKKDKELQKRKKELEKVIGEIKSEDDPGELPPPVF